MAYMSKGCGPGGPYPNKAGEYCGNHHVGSRPLSFYDETQVQADAHQAEYLTKMRFGRPRPCKAGTTAEMQAQGYVGLYLKKDRKLMSWEEECPTPPKLMEPPRGENPMTADEIKIGAEMEARRLPGNESAEWYPARILQQGVGSRPGFWVDITRPDGTISRVYRYLSEIKEIPMTEPKTRRTRVYVAGPMTLGDKAANIRNAIYATDQLIDLGYAPYCPHLTHFQQLMFPRPYEDWMALDFEWLPLCDVLLRLPGESAGADREVALAYQLNIPVMHSPDSLRILTSPRTSLAPADPPFTQKPILFRGGLHIPFLAPAPPPDERKSNPSLSGRRDRDQFHRGRRSEESTGGRRTKGQLYAGRRDPKCSDREVMHTMFGQEHRGGRRVNDQGRIARVTKEG